MAIILPGGFQITNNEAVDSRISVADQTARLGFSAANVYEGLLVYQQDTNEIYVLTNASDPTNNSNWDIIYPVSGSSVSNSGSFSGSFQGDGSGLTNIVSSSYALTASYLEGYIESASFAATASHALTASYLDGFIESASFAATASYFDGFVESASYAVTASYIEMSDAYREDFTNVSSITVNHNRDTEDVLVAVYETTGGTSPQLIIPQSVTLTNDNTAVVTFATNVDGYVIVTDGKGVANTGFTLSSSYATYAKTAGTAVTSSHSLYAVSASYALSSSHEIVHEVSSSYAQTSSYAVTASYVLSDSIVNPTSYREAVTGTTSYTITHNLNENFPIVQAYEQTSLSQEIPSSITSTGANSIDIAFINNFDGTIVVIK